MRKDKKLDCVKMKWAWLCSSLAVLLVSAGLFIVSCRPDRPDLPPTKVQVNIIGNDPFPPPLVGRWKDQQKSWEFVFETDGAISSVVSPPLGWATIVPGKTTIIPMKMGGKGVLQPGQWTLQYDPDTRELSVEVIVEKLHKEVGGGILEGSIRDIFIGRISDDYKQWQATWISFPKYVAYIPERHELPVDPNDTITELLFEKVTE